MKLDDLIKRRAKWLEGSGPFSEIAVSSRIRLARNLTSLPFPQKASKEELQKVIKNVEEAIKSKSSFLKTMILKLDKLPSLDKQFLVERHLISLDHTNSRLNRAVIVDEHEELSIMVNEEDHLRMQVIKSGFQLVKAWEFADKVDDDMSSELEYAFSMGLGYLTACPTNIGTGLRASAMLHLPALVLSKQIDKVLQGVSQLGLTVRGLYGEESKVRSVFFQVSNRLSLGKEEKEIIDSVEKVAKQIIEQEQQTRQNLLKTSKAMILDNIWRAYAILKNARMINSEEMLGLISAMRFGIETGIIKDVSIGVLNELLMLTQPAHIQKILGMEMDAEARDIKRADLIREKLKNTGGTNV